MNNTLIKGNRKHTFNKICENLHFAMTDRLSVASLCCAAARRVASRRVASRRVASRRVASRRVASRRVASRVSR